MKIRVLGSAAGGGLPQWNCGGDHSVRARADDPDVPRRNQSSIAISSGDGRWTIVNASPDVRTQLADFPGLHPRSGTRDIPLDNVLVTSANLENILGLLVLREALPYRVLTTPWIRRALVEHNIAFHLLEPAFHSMKLDQPFPLDRKGVLEAKLLPVPGKVPTYLKEIFNNSAETTLGLRVIDKRTGKRLVYAPGLQTLDSGTMAELAQADLRFVDGTFFTADELRTMRPGTADAIAMGHVPIGGPDGSLTRYKGLGGHTFYTHINNTNPILDAQSPERAQVEAAGIKIAEDGMELEL